MRGSAQWYGTTDSANSDFVVVSQPDSLETKDFQGKNYDMENAGSLSNSM